MVPGHFAFKLSIMVGENFGIPVLSKAQIITRIALKLSTMVGEKFENQYFQMPWNALKLSTMVGKNFEIPVLSKAQIMHRIALKLSTKNLRISTFKCLKMHLNCPPWLEKILKISILKCLELPLNGLSCWGKFWESVLSNALNCT